MAPQHSTKYVKSPHSTEHNSLFCGVSWFLLNAYIKRRVSGQNGRVQLVVCETAELVGQIFWVPRLELTATKAQEPIGQVCHRGSWNWKQTRPWTTGLAEVAK